MQKVIAIALVAGAVIIAAALVYHARQIGFLSVQLEAVQKENAALDKRLQQFSHELPSLIEQGGRNAGRQAIHGAVEEIIDRPMKWVNPKLLQGTSNVIQHLAASTGAADGSTNWGMPLIRFDIPQPVINIRFFPNLKELPDWPWLSERIKAKLSSAARQGEAQPPLPTEPENSQ